MKIDMPLMARETLGSIPGRVIPKTEKMVLDASLLNPQHYKVRIKSKVKQSRERNSALTYLSVVAIKNGALESSTIVTNFTFTVYIYIYIYIIMPYREHG